MSAAVRERTTTHTSRKIVSHGGPISGQRDGAATASSLENNLDALLEDLQTSVSRSATPSRDRVLSPQVEYRVAANPTRVVSEGSRPISPSRTKVTTTEKFVSTGPTGAPSGIPGLELLDAELQNVQPGQSKTIAYKQVSYQYNKDLDGKPDSWVVSENKRSLTGAPLIDDIHETTYEETKTPATYTTYQSPEPIIKKTVVNRELVYGDSSTSRSKQTSPLPGTQRDVKYIHESSYQTDPRSTQALTTVHTSTPQEYKTIEYVPVPSPTPAIPINLAPGPNTKVTTTIKTYTYELPGAPETYLPGGSVPGRNVVLPGDQTITYTLPGTTTTATTDKTVTYQTMTENVPGHLDTSVRYNSPSNDVTEKSTTIHKEAKYYREEHDDPSWKPIYRNAPLPTNMETKTTVTEKYYQVDGNYPNGHGPDDRPDYPGSTTVIYQNQPPTIEHTKTIKRIEEYRSDRHMTPDKPDTPTKMTTTTYYPQHGTPNTTIYKFSNTTSTVPPSKNAEDHEVLLPKPFPTGVQMYPAKPVTNGEGPPKKLEDLMASFSDSEREVLEDIQRQERHTRESSSKKKEVDFIPHTPPKVKSKNVAGPPVYYPPGSAEFTKKEESSAAMSQASGGWQRASGKYEYEASSKSKTKTSKGGAVVPVCLPLCCALPCVIM
ncbi:soluble scavenger receptor cysteine-rich domain-containing protein SSC5D [Camponotus floridanus]|uniref:soluble scavenger receptor cysteine-rich domain-containing protein SSC5D n=1 Tax=Camponotus floridanus TaxID=104421 RepID=UPI00059E04F4|nr:soluble scavenger receptor cysteine-rich domain-containing protein SSC5D [Camponotus floridanus]XP_025266121.1 soluble scavenger receptor cysteine-rich domain-containing protein SSC5D [Camponotus floridanus]